MDRPSLRIPSLVFAWVWVAFILTSIVGVVMMGAADKPVPESHESVREVREAIKSCLAMDGYNATIVTIWNAPVGKPRKPLRWEVTCKPK